MLRAFPGDMRPAVAAGPASVVAAITSTYGGAPLTLLHVFRHLHYAGAVYAG